MHRTIRILPLWGALCTLALAALPVAAGPPWVSVEYPANPHDRSTRNAAFLIHTYHHGDHIRPELRATLEGLIDGQRRTIGARIEATSRPGVYAVRVQRPASGAWIAVVRMRADRAPATALVTLGARNAVLAVDVPTEQQDGWHIPREVTEAEIAAALRGVRALAASDDNAAGGPGRIALAAVLLVVAVGGAGTLRRCAG